MKIILLVFTLILICSQKSISQKKVSIFLDCVITVDTFLIDNEGNDETKYKITVSKENIITDQIYLTKYSLVADCSSESIELGAIDIDSNNIFIYQYFNGADRQGIPLQYGALKREYKIDQNNCRRNTDSSSTIYMYVHGITGAGFLYDSLESEEEKISFKSYIREVEKMYSSKFVFGELSDHLIKETKKILRDEIDKSLNEFTRSYGSKSIYSNILMKY